MYYALIFIASLLFASQFLFNRKFQEECGSTLSSAITFSLYSAFVTFLIMLIINGLKITFSLFALLICTFSALSGILFTYASIKSFQTVNLSAYSVFAMLGGMLLPFVYGIICGEPITLMKLLCCGVIGISILLTINSDKDKKGGKLWYLLVFVLNGMSGVFSKMHQTGADAVDSESFMMLKSIVTVLICVIILLLTEKKIPLIGKKAILYSSLFSLFSGLGNLFTLIALNYLPASVQYPVITGGTMLFSLIISALRKENITKKNIFATVLAFISTILIIF